MANIVITSKGTSGILIDFGVYTSSSLKSPQGLNSLFMSHVSKNGDGVDVVYEGRDAVRLCFCHTAVDGFMIVDTIDGVAPTSAADLVEKLTALM